MERLGITDIESLTEGLGDLYALHDSDAFPSAAVAIVRRLIPGVSHGYTAIDLIRRETTSVVDPAEALFPGGEQILLTYAMQHPLITRFAHLPGHHAVAISDYISRQAFHRLGLYADLYRRLDTEDQLAIGLPIVPGATVGIVINRGNVGFSARDRALLDLLRPHLLQAHRIARTVAALRVALEASDRPVIVLTDEGDIRVAPDRALRLLAQFFPTYSPHATGLPEPVRDWACAQQRNLRNRDDVPAIPQPLLVAGTESQLEIRYIPDPRGGDHLLLLTERHGELRIEALAPLTLGRRESEVLLWVARGKTNDEVADAMSISVRTVQKHLEHIYQKLGVRGRTEAAIRALALMRDAL